MWDEVRARKKEKVMPFVTFADRYLREKTLMSRVRSVNDGDRLQKLVRLAVKASLSEIEAELPKQ
jgi:hypothetical protein